jgi:hypothetical protein
MNTGGGRVPSLAHPRTLRLPPGSVRLRLVPADGKVIEPLSAWLTSIETTRDIIGRRGAWPRTSYDACRCLGVTLAGYARRGAIGA